MRRRYRRGYNRSYSSYRSSYSYGSERARQHIEEAKALSAELGGADEDVKVFLFTLPASRLTTVMDAYEGAYGKEARKYAEGILPKWASNQVTMSGMVAKRLFDLLPRLMLPNERLALTEKLWIHFGPSSHTRFRIGLDVSSGEVAAAIEQHVMATIQEHNIPDRIRTQFSWLAGGDSVAKEAILNHVRRLERVLAVEASRQGSQVLLNHMRNQNPQGASTNIATHTISVGKHRVEMLLDRAAQGLKQEDPRFVPATPPTGSSGFGMGWLIVAAAAVMLFFLFKR